MRNSIAPRLDAASAYARGNPAAVALGAVLVLAAVLRFATIDSQSLDHDETVTAARVLGHSFAGSMHVVFSSERSPPLYYATAWVWSQVFGTGAVALRSLSAILGVLTVLAAYLAGRELSSTRAGLLGALLVAANPYLIWYSQQARSYAMLAALGAFGFYFFARSLRRGDPRSLTGWAVFSALALCTHYFAAFAVVPEGLILLLRPGRTRRVLATVTAVGAVGLALVPLAITQQGTRSSGFASYSLSSRAETAVVKYATLEGPAPQSGLQSTTTGMRQLAVVAVALVLLSVAAVAIRGSPRERRGWAIAFGVATAAFVIPFVLATTGLDFVDPRNLIGALVPGLVAVGIGFSVARLRAVGAAAAAGAMVVFALGLHIGATQPGLQRHNWRAAVAAVPRIGSAGLFVVPTDGRTPMQYYAGGSLPQFDNTSFNDGVAVRRIVVLSDLPQISSPGPQFKLRSTRTAPQHWTIRTYVAPRLEVVEPRQIAGTRVMVQPSTGLVAHKLRGVRAEKFLDTQHGEAFADRAVTRG